MYAVYDFYVVPGVVVTDQSNLEIGPTRTKFPDALLFAADGMLADLAPCVPSIPWTCQPLRGRVSSPCSRGLSLSYLIVLFVLLCSAVPVSFCSHALPIACFPIFLLPRPHSFSLPCSLAPSIIVLSLLFFTSHLYGRRCSRCPRRQYRRSSLRGLL